MAASFHAALRLIFFLLNLTGHWEEALRVAGREHHPAALYGVSMKGADGDVVHLAVHKQDYSFAGFANRSGHWHVFRGDEAVLPNARRLPFSKTYRDLVGGIENVPDLPLGKAASLRAIWALSSYDADVGGGREVVKRGVATLSVVIAQAARLKPILETVDGGWESGEARMAVEHLPYIEHWDTMSFEGLRWEENYVRPPSFTIRKDPAYRLPRVQLSARILKHPFSTSSLSAQNFPFSPLHSPPFPSSLLLGWNPISSANTRSTAASSCSSDGAPYPTRKHVPSPSLPPLPCRGAGCKVVLVETMFLVREHGKFAIPCPTIRRGCHRHHRCASDFNQIGPRAMKKRRKGGSKNGEEKGEIVGELAFPCMWNIFHTGSGLHSLHYPSR